jgi:hypothetical protein
MMSPKEVTIVDGQGKERTIYVSLFPAVQGFEIEAMLPATAVTASISKLGEYKSFEAIMFKALAHVGVKVGNTVLPLNTVALINNHLGDSKGMRNALWEVLQYNRLFFCDGTLLDFLAVIVQKALAKASEMFTQSSEQLLQKVKQPSTNSEQSTQ